MIERFCSLYLESCWTVFARSTAGPVLDLWQEWSSSTSVARAFQLGKIESEAVFNLRRKVAPPIVQFLSEAVRSRGLSRLLNHDVIAKEFLNQGFSSGSGAMEQWKEQLRNRTGNQLALWRIHEKSDF